jgi:hypothetical protein
MAANWLATLTKPSFRRLFNMFTLIEAVEVLQLPPGLGVAYYDGEMVYM